MKRTAKIIAFALSVCLCLGAFLSIGYAENKGAQDLTVYNDNSMVFCYAIKVLTSKSYGQLIENPDIYKPLWLLAREIAVSKEYNESYKNTAEGIEILGSDSYAIKNIKTDLITDYTKNAVAMYLDIFSEDATSAEVLSKCLAIESYLTCYADLITVNDEIYAVSSFCKSTIEKLKKDIAFYDEVTENNLEAFEALAAKLKSADRKTLLAEYGELHTLYLSTSMARGASEATVELYKDITLKYRIFASANECVKSLAVMIEGNKITPDELYDCLSGINYFLNYADSADTEVMNAKTVYHQKLSDYNEKYTSHNTMVNRLNKFAGGICLSNITDSENRD